ncbi:TPA: hypothetical protein U4R04_001831 [Streptococcus agalactiae]|uniref:hypothetical protein n=1 Tax=Streptococcus agalactiae TaxID=1311 RepID=UPI0002BAF442|nr:hypothetical protein [Streptococcus agalactiae]ASA89500.1 hypothetical protein BB164_02700 [Streptococcus agalactiae]EPT58631.1 hypothetical protein SAG0058_01765 [Streptococcus agalactiae CCUG 37430]EPT95228.1 hypothetical protein SAG0102_11275 [Streptococcus agalactiae BSU188]EPV01428.1 hypothetical protein SAG0324_03305 [Streptococcus agalactiae GB00300]EPW23603.1 hypothetical protein SAG0062_03225 [Streptococcus agalactiae CCUG 37739]
MKAYDKFLNEEKDRLVEVHTKWLKEVDLYIEDLQEQLVVSEQKLTETTEIFIERFERLEKRIKELEKPDQQFVEATIKNTEKGLIIDRLRGKI